MTDSTPSNASVVPATTELAENRPGTLRQRAETVPFVDLARPVAGNVATVDVQPGHALKLKFDLNEVTGRKVDGENLELSFDDGGKLVLHRYLQLAEDDVSVLRKDGTPTDLNELVLPSASNPEVSQGDVANSGHFYSQYDPGRLGDGIDHLGGLGDDDVTLGAEEPDNRSQGVEFIAADRDTGPQNTPPLAVDDAAATEEETAITVNVLANDSDPNADVVTVIGAGNGARGTTSVLPNGEIVYTPNADAFGTDSFVYTITDGNGGAATASVVITIDGINDPPVAADDTGTTDEDTALTINVLANDSDVDGGPLTVIGAGNGANGTTGIGNDGSIVYTPDADFSGTDSFVYTITDGNGGTASALVTVTVLGVNDPPLAADDTATTTEDNAVTVNVLGNDTDIDGGALTVISAGNGANGTTSIGAGGDIAYTPTGDFFGTDSFVYTITDGNGGTASAVVTVTVLGVNDPPVAADDTATTNEDNAVTVSVLANDTDIDGGPLTVISAGNGANGTTSVGPSGEIVYTPNGDFFGTDSFTYVITDGNGGTSSALVTVTVLGVNDPPLASDDATSTNEDNAVVVNVLGNDSDIDGGALTVTSASNGANGTTSIGVGGDITYLPTGNFFGTDSFTYTITDGNGGTASATVTVTVLGVDDAPVAADDSATTNEDTSVTVNVLTNDTDIDNDPLTVISAGNGANGTTSVAPSGDIVYTPNQDFHGTDSFVYTITDGNGGTASATVIVTVLGVNDPPVAGDNITTTNEDTAVTVAVLTNDSDVDGDPLTITSASNGVFGNTSIGTDGQIVYTPLADFTGTDFFTYTITDGNGGTSSATVSVVVLGVNDAPVARDDSTVTGEDFPVTVGVLGNDTDIDGGALTVTSAGNGAHGTTSIAPDGGVLYTPDTNFNGTDSFTYTISDGNGGTASAVSVVTIVSLNDDPLLGDDDATTNEDNAVTINVLANDSDPDGNILTLTSADTPAHGSVSVDIGGQNIVYTPDAGFVGTDSFVYTVIDGNGGGATAMVVVTVLGINDPPLAADDSATGDEDTAIAVNVLGNDSDIENDSLTVTAAGNGAHGTTSVAPGGTVVYTPEADFFGTDSFVYTISDGNGGTSSATVTVTVQGVNDAPIANDDSATAAEDQPFPTFIDVRFNDTDIDGNALTLIGFGAAAHGVLSTSGGGMLYTPEANFFGTDSFVYTISDGNGGTATATVTVTVAGSNDPPTPQPDDATTLEDNAVTISVLANDTDPDGDALGVFVAGNGLHGTTSIGSDGTIVYTPDADFNGTDSFTYAVTDAAGVTAGTTVVVTVIPVNDLVDANDDLYTGSEGSPLSGNVFDNDSAPDGLGQVTLGTGPLHGTVVMQTDGSFTYTPDENYYSGPAFLTAGIRGNTTLTGFQGTQRLAALPDGGFIAVWIGQQDAGQTGSNAYGVYGQRFDAAGNPVGPELQINSILPGHDATPDVTVLADGGFVAVWSHEGQIWGRVFDADGTPRTAELVIDNSTGSSGWPSVQALNGGGFAVVWDDSVGASSDRDISLRLYDADGNPTTAAITTNVVDLTWALQFIPTITELDNGNIVVAWTSRNQDSVGNNDGVIGRIFAPDGTPLTGEIVLNTTVALNQLAPSLAPLSGGGFVAVWTAAESGTDGVFGQRFDDLGNKLGGEFHVNTTIAGAQSDSNVVGLPNGGFVVFWNSASNSADPDTYDVYAQVYDAAGIRIGGELLVNDNVTGFQAGPSAALLANGDIAISWGGNAPGGDGQDIYVRILTTHEQDRFTYTVTDADGDTASATVYLDVLGTPDAPTAVDDSASVLEDAAVSVSVLANDTDIDGDPVTLIGVGNGAHGTAAIQTNGTIRYTPEDDYTGTDSFVYTITDGNGGTATATVTITVNGVNDDPDAAQDDATTSEESPVTIAVLANDTDIDGDTLTVTGVSGTDWGGTVTLNPDGTITYTPPADFSGVDFFTYQITDGNGGADTEVVLVTVTGVNDAPLAGDDTASTDEDLAITVDVLANDTDPDGDAPTIVSVGNGMNGTTSVTTDGQIVYTPDAEFSGTDSFVYTITDGNGGTASASVVVTINNVDELVAAADDAFTGSEGSPVSGNVFPNDDAPDGLGQITLLSGPAHGTVVMQTDGSFEYTPDAEYYSQPTFLTGDIRANTTTSDQQFGAHIAALPTGGFIAVWESNQDPGQSGLNLRGVYGQRFDASGNAVGAEFQINTTQPGLDGQAKVAVLADGGYVVTWSRTVDPSNFSAGVNVMARVFNADGTPQTGEIVVDNSPFTNSWPDVTALAGGGFAVVWDNQVVSGSDRDIGLRIFDADGNAVTGGLTANILDGARPLQFIPTVEELSNGNIVVGWSSRNQDVPGSTLADGVILRVFDASGNPLTGEIVANTFLANSQVDPAFTALAGGGFVVTWTSTGQEVGQGIYGQVFDNAGNKVGGELHVNSTAAGDQWMSDVVALPNGGFVVTWSNTTSSSLPNTFDVYAQIYSAAGSKIGNEIVVNQGLTGFQGTPQATVLENGDVVFAWTGDGPGSVGQDTYFRILNTHQPDQFTYVVTDADGDTASATVYLDILGTPDAPVANPDQASVAEDSQVTIAVLPNDTDIDGDPVTLIGASDGAHGTTTMLTDGTVRYRPVADYNGTDSFAYTITDGNGGTASSTVTVTVNPANDAPLAQDDEVTTGEDTPITISVLANDSDLDGDALTLVSVSDTEYGGTATLNPDGTITYLPPAGSNTNFDSFIYYISDGHGGVASAAVIVNIVTVNDAPILGDDTATTNEDTPVVVDVLGNDTDEENNALTVLGSGDGANGTTSLTTDGQLLYTPNPEFSGTDSFVYTVSDGNGGTSTATVVVTVTGVNDAPLAGDDTASTAEDLAITVDVLANDSDIDGDTPTVLSVGDGAGGTTSIGTDGQIVYTPNPGFSGTDSFIYTITDGNGGTASASVMVSVDGMVRADDDIFTGSEGSPLAGNVFANDDAPDGLGQVTLGTGPLHGTVSLQTDGSFTYTPDENYFSLPVFRSGDIRGNTTLSGFQGNQRIEALPDGGFIAVWTGQQDAGQIGSDAYGIYGQRFDATGNPVGPELQINSVLPGFDGTPDVSVLADGGYVVVWSHNQEVWGRVFDADGTPRTAELVIASNPFATEWPSVQALAGGGFAVVWDDQVSSSSNDRDIGFRLFDANGNPTTAAMTANVVDLNWPVQFIPSITELANGNVVVAWTSRNQDSVGNNDGVIGRVFAPDGTPLTGEIVFNTTLTQQQLAPSLAPLAGGGFVASWTASQENGTGPLGVFGQLFDDLGNKVGGEFHANTTIAGNQNNSNVVGLPNGGFVVFWNSSAIGGASNTYDVYAQVYDAGGIRVGGELLVNQNVTGFQAGPTASVLANGDIAIMWSGDAPGGEGQDIYFRILTAHEPDQFTYTVTDADGDTASATVYLDIVGAPDAPVAVDDNASVLEDAAVSVSVLANDTDIDGDQVTLIGVTSGAHGTAVIQTNGTIRYTPEDDYTGTDSFVYTITDGNGGTASATVTMTVNGANDDPTAVLDEATTDENTPITISVLANDTDPENDPLTVTSVGTTESGGTVTINGDGTITYTPPADFNGGIDYFSYDITDGNGGADSSIVLITIDGVNDAPLAADDEALTDENVAVTIDVLANDTDPDFDTPTVLGADQGSGGTTTVVGGQIVYTPDADYEGVDSFVYTIADGNGGTATATVTVGINGVNVGPLAIDDDVTTAEDTPLGIDVLGNDSDPDNDALSFVTWTGGTNGGVAFESGELIYAPNTGFAGTDSFTYTISDGNGGTASATVTVTVMSDNNSPLIAEDDGFTVDENQTFVSSVAINDTVVIAPAHFGMVDGFLSGSINFQTNGTFDYTPGFGFEGTESFTYLIVDYDGHTASATTTITVLGVNVPPDTEIDYANISSNTPSVIDVLDNDGDYDDNDVLTVIGSGAGAHGQSTVQPDGTVVYTSNPGFVGTDTFLYTVSDGNGGTSTESVLVYVTEDGVNAPPIAADDFMLLRPDTGQWLYPLNNDIDLNFNSTEPYYDMLTIVGVSAPSVGTVSITAEYELYYEPNPLFEGTDSFVYTVSDGNGGMATATFVVSLAYYNTPPVATDDDSNGEGGYVPVNANDVSTIDVLNYGQDQDYDPDGDPLTVIGFSDSAHGTIMMGTSGTLLYMPDLNYTGLDQFSYTISDGNGGSASAMVVVDVYGEVPETPTDDFIVGSAYQDSLAGDLGIDTMMGLGDADYFYIGAAGPTDYDRILDFNASEDMLDINGLITDFFSIDDLSDYVQFVENNGNTEIYVSADGQPENFKHAVDLVGVTGLNPVELVQDGHLFVPVM